MFFIQKYITISKPFFLSAKNIITTKFTAGSLNSLLLDLVEL
jgi:hypothetical protein